MTITFKAFMIVQLPMRTFDTLQPPSIELADREYEPLAITEERLAEFLQYVEVLWSEHADALRQPARENLDKIRDNLHNAYDQLEQMSDFLDQETTLLFISADTLEMAKSELTFSRQNLHKVLK